ncbi:InlB B-repeat-containing protein [Candidatus Izemoplasma sp. B36]|uniref:InlB B-repeat-containing protein n=1 Tax=Candidatus Izemoplasma sp. B36 TaxID=3242468 RepID=UPI0035571E89
MKNKHMYMIISIFIALFFVACDSNTSNETTLSTLNEYEVIFDSNGGILIDTMYISEGNQIPIPETSRTGYTIDGWYTSNDSGVSLDEAWIFTTDTVSSDITLYAKWVANEYDITYIIDGESTIITQTYGDEINFPNNPIKVGYTFSGWYTDELNSNLFDTQTVPAEDISLYAGWEAIPFQSNMTLTIHYYRFDQDYGDWNIFMWSKDPEYIGSKYEFTVVDKFWRTIEIDLSETNMNYTTEIGFIVMKGDWLEKDTDYSRSIDLSSYNIGEDIDIYLVEGDDEVYLNKYNALYEYDRDNLFKDYYVVGQFNGWDTTLSGKMHATSILDNLLFDLTPYLDYAQYIYVSSIYLSSSDSGWDIHYIVDGENITFNGNLALKIIRTTVNDSDARDWWAQSPESGPIINLTPDTLFIPEYTGNVTLVDVEGLDIFTTGSWNDNPVAFEPGSYYVVFIEFIGGAKGLGLIPY